MGQSHPAPGRRGVWNLSTLQVTDDAPGFNKRLRTVSAWCFSFRRASEGGSWGEMAVVGLYLQRAWGEGGGQKEAGGRGGGAGGRVATTRWQGPC